MACGAKVRVGAAMHQRAPPYPGAAAATTTPVYAAAAGLPALGPRGDGAARRRRRRAARRAAAGAVGGTFRTVPAELLCCQVQGVLGPGDGAGGEGAADRF